MEYKVLTKEDRRWTGKFGQLTRPILTRRPPGHYTGNRPYRGSDKDGCC